MSQHLQKELRKINVAPLSWPGYIKSHFICLSISDQKSAKILENVKIVVSFILFITCVNSKILSIFLTVDLMTNGLAKWNDVDIWQNF